MAPRFLVVATLVGLVISLASCGKRNEARDEEPSIRLRVAAASSLTETFTTLKATFEREHPDVDVVLTLGPSPQLATQVSQGAPVDVLAVAGPEVMDIVVQSGDVQVPTIFAQNTMALVIPAANPARISRAPDIARPDVRAAICQASVPCGRIAAEVLRRNGIQLNKPTEEADVKAVLTKVRLGEVDAGLVYRTDARAAGSDVRVVPLPGSSEVFTTYPIAVITAAAEPVLAQQFVDLVRSDVGRAIFTQAGFTSR
ncbi:MAG: molybdate ABC transporter substrate-binding protein [Actinomycetota bacterium]